MNRRSVLGAIFGIVASCFVAIKPQRNLTVLFEEDSTVAKVSGHPDDIMKFHESWQTNLWPDWKTSRLPNARKDRNWHEEYVRRNKFLRFWIGKEDVNCAVQFAIHNCGVPCVVS